MIKYIATVPLIGEYIYENKKDFSKSKSIKFEEFSFEEPIFNVKVTIKSNFEVVFSDLVCSDNNAAITVVAQILPDICKIMTVLLNIQTVEDEKSHFCFAYVFSKLKIDPIEENVPNSNESKVVIADHMFITDSLHMNVTYTINFDRFQPYYSKKDLIFVDVIYRAMRCRDFESIFFTLFTMIEYIESKDSKEFTFDKLLSDSETSSIKESIEKILSNNKKNRIMSRLNGLFQNATDKTRAEKLCHIIQSKYKIEKVVRPPVNYDITPEKLDKFINLRNKLFHGSASKDELPHLTNELLFLCLSIIDNYIK